MKVIIRISFLIGGRFILKSVRGRIWICFVGWRKLFSVWKKENILLCILSLGEEWVDELRLEIFMFIASDRIGYLYFLFCVCSFYRSFSRVYCVFGYIRDGLRWVFYCI